MKRDLRGESCRFSNCSPILTGLDLPIEDGGTLEPDHGIPAQIISLPVTYTMHLATVCQICEMQLQQYGGRRIAFGRIRTVRCLGDNLLIRQMLQKKTDGDFAVKALGSNRPKSEKYRKGCIDAVVSFGRVSFTPGHWLYTDADGILVSSRALHL